jgi:hypothetical protein
VTPDEEERVRRALAEAPPAGPMPPEVVARLEATLAELGRDRSPVPVDDLEARRRRRWPRVLVAAASVAVLAYGAGTVLTGVSGSGDAAMSTAARDETFSGGAGSGSADGGQGAPKTAPPSAPGMVPSAGNGLDAQAQRDPRALTDRTVTVHRDTLRSDVLRLVRAGAVSGQGDTATRDTDGRLLAGLVAPCETPALGPYDRLAAVRLDGRRATLVLRAPTAGTSVAQVYACGDASRLVARVEVDTAR